MKNDDLTKRIMDFAPVTADDNDQLKSSYSQESCGSEQEEFNPIAETKTFRQALDWQLQNLKNSPRKSSERSIAITKIQEAIMWLGMDLKDLGTPNPYPQSYNPSNNQVEPTADGLKL